MLINELVAMQVVDFVFDGFLRLWSADCVFRSAVAFEDLHKSSF